MTRYLTADAIRAMGFDWPGLAAIAEASVEQDGLIDLDATLDRLREGRALAQKQISAAYAFKQNTGADYGDFTNRLDDYVRQRAELTKAITALETLVAALEQ